MRRVIIVKPEYLNDEELYPLISDVESAWIYLMSDSLIHKNKCTLSCNPGRRIKIINIGYRGDLPPEMYITDEDDLFGLRARNTILQ